jgi:hypothetical protein
VSTSQQSPSRRQAPERGPARFRAPEPAQQKRSVLKVLGAALVLVALVAGIPAALVAVGAPTPIPTGLPDKSDLTQPLTTGAILVLLTAVVWLAWIQFVVCTLVEVVSALRGNGLPRPVPLSGRSQQLARALVGTVLVGGTFLGTAGTASAATPTHAPAVSAAVQQDVGGVVHTEQQATPDQDVQRADGTVDVHQTDTRAAQGGGLDHHAGVPRDMKDVVGKKVYVVKPPRGHYHDNLWDIAEQHLGNGRRWHDIFQLNQDRPQPDGGHLVQGRLIQPGWVLVMPDDATGLERVTDTPAPSQHGDGGGSGAAATRFEQRVASTPDSADDGGQVQDSLLSRDLLGGGLFTAVLLGALLVERRRRRGRAPSGEALEAEVALRVGADPDRAERLDAALRGLSASCRNEQTALPAVFAVTVTDESIDLLLAPPRTDAPAPWTPVDDGRLWRLGPDAPEPTERGHAPFPGLVCLGRDLEGADLLIDLESVGGVVSVEGADPVATEVVSALAVQLATSPWSDEQKVRGYRLSEVLADLAGDRLVLVDDLDPVLRELEASQPRRNAQEVLTGRLARRPGVVPEYAVLGAAPEGEVAERLATLSSAGSRGFGVLATGHVPGTRWQLEVDETGTLTIPLLDQKVDAVRLTESSADELAELFEKARMDAPSLGEERAPIPAPPRPGDDGRWSAAPVRVGVLGPVDARTPGVLDATRVPLATEVLTFLALQPSPVHPSVLAASVWPRGVTSEVRDATVERVRDWLGTDTEGNHHLRSGDDGRLSLGRDVSVDWHAFCELATRARHAGAREERELLRRALHLVRGEFLQGRPSGRYSWLARTRLEGSVADVVVDAAHRLSVLCTNDRDPAGASAAARAGLRLAPGSQLLWRDLLRSEHDGPGGAEAASDAASEMVEVLGGRGASIDAETDALVEELLPAQQATG